MKNAIWYTRLACRVVIFPYLWHNTTQILVVSSDFRTCALKFKTEQRYTGLCRAIWNRSHRRCRWRRDEGRVGFFSVNSLFVLIVVSFLFCFFLLQKVLSLHAFLGQQLYSTCFGLTGAREFSGTQAVFVIIESYNRFMICNFFLLLYDYWPFVTVRLVVWEKSV